MNIDCSVFCLSHYRLRCQVCESPLHNRHAPADRFSISCQGGKKKKRRKKKQNTVQNQSTETTFYTVYLNNNKNQ